MGLELKQEQAINEHLRENLKQLEERKDEHLSKLASELGNVNAINKRLESELERARGELLGGETAINNLKFELMEKDRALDNLKLELEEKEQAIANLQTELDNRLAEAARNEIFLNEELERFKYGIIPGEDGDTPANPASPHNTQDLKTLIKSWKRQSKSTRDWTKANQLISELENLL